MTCWSLVVAVALLAAGASAVESPYVVECVDTSITLEVQAARVTVAGVLTYTTRAYHYGGVAMVPAPTIVMKPGHWCAVSVANKLSDQGQDGCPRHVNDMHCANHTVLHTHGLHVSPHQDNINTNVPPGETLTYVYDIPSNHMPGTHWYHAHKHGSTALQVTGGMAGALLIEPDDSDKAILESSHPDTLLAYEGSQLLVLMHHFFGDSDGGGGFGQMNYQDLSASFGVEDGGDNLLQPDPVFASGADEDFYSVNGELSPSVALVHGVPKVLRMLHAAGIRVLRLEITDFVNIASCTATLVARDGVFHHAPFSTVTELVFVQGTRADYEVTCSLADDTLPGMATVAATAPPSGWALGNANVHEQADVFTLAVAPNSGGVSEDGVTAPYDFPEYLGDMDGEALTDTFDINVGQGGGINGDQFAGFHAPLADRYLAEMCVGGSYQFNLNAGGPAGGVGASAHPYHQHINHFQVTDLGSSGFTDSIVKLGEWRDVVPSHKLTVKHKAWDFYGDIVMHCHILQHEDRGMMGLYYIHECCATDSDCDDGDSCTTDSCDSGKCTHTVAAADAGSSCQATSYAGSVMTGQCGDAGCDMCADVTCESPLECQQAGCRDGHCYLTDLWGNDCGDGLTCDEGMCAGCGSDTDCDDGNECTTESCDGSGNCQYQILDGVSCSNGACNQGICETIGGSGCTSDSDCTDNLECTTDSCNSDGTCLFVPQTGASCNSGQGTCDNVGICNDNGSGNGNDCAGDDANCNDNDDCTVDSCNADGSCSYTTVAGCGSGNGGCSSDAECTDNLECTTDSCNSDGTCLFAPQTGASCNGGQGTCDSVGICNDNGSGNGNDCAGDDANCNDNDDCTVDTCNADGSCSYTTVAGCGSGNGSGDGCDSDCSDGNECTNDWCDNGSCEHSPRTGESCSTGMCNGSGSCVATCTMDSDCSGAKRCSASGMCYSPPGCTMDSDCPSGDRCNAVGGCYTPGPACATNEDCDAGKMCMGGSCEMDPCSQEPVADLFRFNDGTVDMVATTNCAGTGFQCGPGTPTRTASGTTYYLVAQWDDLDHARSCGGGNNAGAP